jgi:hypothetical protein
MPSQILPLQLQCPSIHYWYQPMQMDLHPSPLSMSQQPMSLYLTILSNALHQHDYRPTPTASLLHKLLHRLLYQFSRPQPRPNHAANEFTLTCSNALQQPMSSRFIHVYQRPAAANESSSNDTRCHRMYVQRPAMVLTRLPTCP